MFRLSYCTLSLFASGLFVAEVQRHAYLERFDAFNASGSMGALHSFACRVDSAREGSHDIITDTYGRTVASENRRNGLGDGTFAPPPTTSRRLNGKLEISCHRVRNTTRRR